MTNRYKNAFETARAAGRGAFIPFTMLGWPNPADCWETIKVMVDEGATALELGIAFSDPVADGPVIQKAACETLDSGFSVNNAFALIGRIRQYNQTVPIGVLTYFNVVLATGADRFYRQAADCGVDSVLLADLPPDEYDEVAQPARQNDISPVFIASPMTGAERLRLIAQYSSAYIYVVSRLGITGVDERHDDNLRRLFAEAKQTTKLPLCVGFGVSSPEAARRMLADGADGVITGSRIIDIIRGDQSPHYPSLRNFIKQMCQSVATAAEANI
jgi:tryptophan synthase alpha chain